MESYKSQPANQDTLDLVETNLIVIEVVKAVARPDSWLAMC